MKELNSDSMALTCQFGASWIDALLDVWQNEISGETDAIFTLLVETRYPGCILTVYLVKQRLEEMEIPVEMVYMAAKSKVIIIELGTNAQTASEVNEEMKRQKWIQPCGWLIVGKEYEEDGSEEKQSCR